MLLKKIVIKKKDGINFAKLSGDNNPIHIKEKIGNASQFGENIVHGCLILIKILKVIKLQKYHSIKVNFKSFVQYNLKSKIILYQKNNRKKIYYIYQNNQLKIILNIFLKSKDETILLKYKTHQTKYKISKKKKKKFHDNIINADLKLSLCELSKYVGIEYPGRHSLINEINIFKKESFLQDNIIHIKSNKIDKRFNLIENQMRYNKYFIDFKTSIRPTLNIKLKKPNTEITKEIKNIKNNILIIGGSSGIGNDLMKLFLINKKIKVISTFYKNKITTKKKNLIVYKIDITKKITNLFKIIKKYYPLNIYYFATPLIDVRFNNDINYDLYNKYYVTIPIKLAKYSLKYNNNFFYPSTIFINEKDQSNYSLSKYIFEKKVKTLKKRNNKINILRLPRINTKHNLNLLNEKLPNFRSILFNSKQIRKSIFFYN